MELIQLQNEMVKLYKLMNKDIEELYRIAPIKAETERIYQKELAIELKRLREEGLPTTLISDIAKGNCSELRFNMNNAEDSFAIVKTSLNVREKQASMLQTLIKIFEEV